MGCRAAHKAKQVYTEAAQKAGARFDVQQQERLVGRAVQPYMQLAMGPCTALYRQRLEQVRSMTAMPLLEFTVLDSCPSNTCSHGASESSRHGCGEWRESRCTVAGVWPVVCRSLSRRTDELNHAGHEYNCKLRTFLGSARPGTSGPEPSSQALGPNCDSPDLSLQG